MTCVPKGGGLVDRYLGAPRVRWKYGFIAHVVGEDFEETTCAVTSVQLETTESCL